MTAILEPTPSDLVTVEVSGTAPQFRVTASGEIDSSSAPVLRQHLESLLGQQPSEITIDLGGVTFLDSAGLCVLAAAHRRASGNDVRLRVLASSRAVVRPLQITGLWNLLNVEQVESAAPSIPAQQGS